MKKIIAIAAIIASAQASAFFGDNNGSYYNNGNGAFDTAGNGEGEATFSMNFSGKGKTDMRAAGKADDSFNGYNGYAPYYGAPVAPMAAPVAPAAK